MKLELVLNTDDLDRSNLQFAVEGFDAILSDEIIAYINSELQSNLDFDHIGIQIVSIKEVEDVFNSENVREDYNFRITNLFNEQINVAHNSTGWTELEICNESDEEYVWTLYGRYNGVVVDVKITLAEETVRGGKFEGLSWSYKVYIDGSNIHSSIPGNFSPNCWAYDREDLFYKFGMLDTMDMLEIETYINSAPTNEDKGKILDV